MMSLCVIFRTKFADRKYKKKFLHTLCCIFCFIAVGLTVTQTGPAFLDLQLITNTNTQQASAFLTASSVGSMIGSLSMGFVYGRWEKTTTMSVMSLATAVTVSALPWCSSYILMIAMHGISAMFRSAFSTAVTVEVIRTWAPESRVFVQILNTGFSVGATLAPLVTQPFLAPRTQDNTTQVSDNTSIVDHSQLNVSVNSERNDKYSILVLHNTTESRPALSTHVQLAYLIPGVWFLLGSCMFLIQRFWVVEEEQSTLTSGSYESLDKPLPRCVFITTIVVLSLIFFFLVSINSSLSAYLVTFTVTYLDWTKSDGSNLTTVLWLTNAIWRFLTIFYTKFVSPFKLILISSFIILLATIGSVFSSLYHYDIGVWICTAVTGLCTSSQVPSLMMWTEESIMRLTPGIVSVINFAITCPGMVIPPVLGYLMQEVSPMWIYYFNLIKSGFLLILLIFAYMWVKLVIHPPNARLNRAYSWKGDLTKSDGN